MQGFIAILEVGDMTSPDIKTDHRQLKNNINFATCQACYRVYVTMRCLLSDGK